MSPQESDYQDEERRRAPRVKGVVVEYSRNAEEDFSKSAFMKDMSILGLCIFVPERLDIDTKLYLKIYLSGSEVPLQVEGRVVWQKMSSYLNYFDSGIEFADLGDTDHKRLTEYINNFIDEDLNE